jgi:hypothetical protein
MTELHQFTFRIEPDLLREGCFRWVILRSGQPQMRSEISYATRDEAEADAIQALNKRIVAWLAVRGMSI